MKRTRTYRIAGLALAAVFGMFNIGIPIIVASCPLAATMQGNRCSLCSDVHEPGTVSLSSERNTSCCVTVFAAERNTNEFVQVTHVAASPNTLMHVLPATHVPTAGLSSLAAFLRASTAPLFLPDIPLLTSNLRI